MKFYIVWFDSITQYDVTNHGYYVGYKDKCEDYFSENYIFAKKYKSLGAALTRIGISFTDYDSVRIIKKINLDIKNSLLLNRKKKLSKLDNVEYSDKDDRY